MLRIPLSQAFSSLFFYLTDGNTLRLVPTTLGTGDFLVFTEMGDIFSLYQDQNLKPKANLLTFDCTAGSQEGLELFLLIFHYTMLM